MHSRVLVNFILLLQNSSTVYPIATLILLQRLQNLPESIVAVRDTITASIETLVECSIAKQPYPDLDHLCAYHQYALDYARFQLLNKEYSEKVKSDTEAEVAQSRREFQVSNARLREKIIWDWCPIWRILNAYEKLVKKLSAMPWTHNSKYLIITCYHPCF